MIIREYRHNDLPAMAEIWNQVVADGIAFPQMETLSTEQAGEFFGSQSYTAVAEEDAIIWGLYILHPNNVGRCGHIANSSYAVTSSARGRGIGEKLVSDSLVQAKNLGFKILQFNAVVSTNTSAIALYRKLGFVQLGTIPGGFLLKDNTYEDIMPFYRIL